MDDPDAVGSSSEIQVFHSETPSKIGNSRLKNRLEAIGAKMTIHTKPSMGLKDAIEKHRATKAFQPAPIPNFLLEEIFTLGIHTPSG
ncbi:hypothetical protein [Coleofasciculus sp. FACHB-129]|uniref:hypothetical protein n=1 Tax=Cyanophyceae TaxID=3028117 RepID=UPI0016899522|nr:hypothetical protein [Coleofasciculus sp. FACHB-129]MBD1896370.1 hypothetical protein [Coleofasciculus sp. FACHB-129]